MIEPYQAKMGVVVEHVNPDMYVINRSGIKFGHIVGFDQNGSGETRIVVSWDANGVRENGPYPYHPANLKLVDEETGW